jgi:hypothetical protein
MHKHEWYITHDFDDNFAPVGECVCGEQFDEGEINHRLNCFDELVEALERVVHSTGPGYLDLAIIDGEAALATAKGEQSE